MKKVDICFIVEGSYPYVRGGVASWVDQIIKNMPEFSFGVVAISASSIEKYEFRYPKHDNLKWVKDIYLYQPEEAPVFLPEKFRYQQEIVTFLNSYFSMDLFEKFCIKMINSENKQKLKKEILFSKSVYSTINQIYENNFPTKSYLDFYWGVRSLLSNFSNVLLADIPKAKVYHAVSTGYAGLYMAMAKMKYPHSKVFVTEHGIYTRERSMDITITDWADRDYLEFKPKKSVSIYRDIWNKIFHDISKVTYHYADTILSLNEKNNLIQMEEGAPAEKVSFIRNGVNLDRFKFEERFSAKTHVVGFLGRVTKIKDVKTLIKAAKIVIDKYPDSKFKIAGPTEEQPEYYQECKELVEVLELENNVTFEGMVQSDKFFEEIDIMVLTSISEGQPLVIAEANACGVPVVSTNVGGCSEMLLGGGDDTIGPSGIVTKSVNPEDTAKAIIRFFEEDDFYHECSLNARERALLFYNEKNFIQAYKNIYKNLGA